MKHSVHKEIFGIRKLKAGVCSVVLALSFLGTQQILASEVVTSTPPTENKEAVLPPTTPQTNPLSDNPVVSKVESSPIVDGSENEKGLGESVPVTHPENSSLSTSEEKSPKVEIDERSVVAPPSPVTEMAALNVKDFGAVGDGVTDDRQAIQDTMDAAATGLGAGKVYFPEGTYFVEEILFLRSHTHLELNEKATILNGINQKNHPSIVFMTGLFTDDGDQVNWEPTEDITFTGGTIDMNVALNEEGTKAKNLPLINSSGAFAIGNATNVTIRNVTFKDSYQGHAIQIAGSKNVLVDNSRFLGQALPKTMKDGQIISKESVQIEPLTRKGFPYALNDDGKKSENVTIQNSYFGKSDKSGELVTAIGTHYQTLKTENPSNIKILNNHFDNMMYAGIRFTGFTDILIKGNRFDKKVKEESIHYRENGAALVNAYSYKNLKDVLDLNKHVVVTDNVFNIADPKTKAIRVARDSAEYLGKVTDITVTKNTIINTSEKSEVPNIQMTRISDHLNVSGNKVNGGYQGISIENSTGNITVKDNQLSGLSGTYAILTESGDKGKISVSTHGVGALEITTAKGNYHIKANNLGTHSYVATYSDGALTEILNTQAEFTVPLAQAENFERYLQFKPNTTISVTGDLTKEYDGQTVHQDLLKVNVTGSSAKVSYTYYADKDLMHEIAQPKEIGKYWLKLSVAGDENFAPATVILPFYIFVKAVPQTAPVAEELPEFKLPSSIPEEVEQTQSDSPQPEINNLISSGQIELSNKPSSAQPEIKKVANTDSSKGKGELPKTGESILSSFALSIIGAGMLAGVFLQKRKDER